MILLIRLMIVVTRLLPLAHARALGRWVGAGLYHLNSRMRRVAIRNLELAYPDWPPSRRRSLARQSVQSTGELMAEMGRVWTQPWSRTESMIEVEGVQCVTEALATGQGVIVLGPHLGNWELLGMHLATLGNLVALYEPLPFRKLDQLVHRSRQRTGGKLVPTTPRGIAELVRSVRAGGITGILPDQVPSDERAGLNVPFLELTVLQPRWQATSSESQALRQLWAQFCAHQPDSAQCTDRLNPVFSATMPLRR